VILRDDLNLSVSRLYGSRDFTGSSGEIIVGPPSPPGESIVGPPGPPGESIVELPGSDASNPSWIDESQSNVLIESFGGDLHANRITNLFLNNISGYLDSSRVNNLPLIPTCVNYETQSQVQLSGFGGSIPANRISGLP